MSQKVIHISSQAAIMLLFSVSTWAQRNCLVTGSVRDSSTHKPLAFCTLLLQSEAGAGYGVSADEHGQFRCAIPTAGRYTITISYIGYKTQTHTLNLQHGQQLAFSLSINPQDIESVVVTATASREQLTSSSRIDRTAMEHLQPTSFSDLLALLPGGQTSAPNMSAANTIALREVPISSGQYTTGALGTQFVIDGHPISTNANLQAVADDISTSFDSRSSVNTGVDMRTLSTDNIESVEVVRGIPSVEYGDLTNGVVLIQRKARATPLEARFKSDEFGKLIHVGKGLSWDDRQLIVNTDAGFLDSHHDPRDRMNSFRRLNGSIRVEKRWAMPKHLTLRLNASADYAGNVDAQKKDPDILTQPEDNFSASYHSAGLKATVRLLSDGQSAFSSLSLTAHANASFDHIERTKFVQLDRDRAVPTNTAEGVHDAAILPYKYNSQLTVDGKPINLFVSLKSIFKLATGAATHRLSGGINLKYDKNMGEGQVYDPARPINIYLATRPRRYRDIPAMSQLSAFAEDRMSLALGSTELQVQAGLRANMLLNLSHNHAMHGKIYIDPRINIRYQLPHIAVGHKQLTFSLQCGAGKLTKMPTLAHLHPDRLYIDLVQLNYWHKNSDYKRINLQTYIVDRTNLQLQPASNLKGEVSMGIDYGHNKLSVTYFRERMESGFRSTASYKPYTYTNYDASAIDHAALTAPPDIALLPYTIDTVLRGSSRTTNGSLTRKEGVEFVLTTERFKGINTRFTLNGAWFRTLYSNSQPVWAQVSEILAGTSLANLYAARYVDDNIYIREQLTQNLTTDVYLPALGTKLSATLECTWFYAHQSGRKDGRPIAYMGTDGIERSYTEAEATDPYLKILTQHYSDALFKRYVEPFHCHLNFKATKDFKHVQVSLFADRIMDYMPDYYSNGLLVRRTAASPYFGMEINLKL